MTESVENPQFFAEHLYVQNSNVHGRGVFANKLFAKDEIIEVFPLSPLAFRTRYQGDYGILTYGFINDQCPCEECKRHGNVIYLGMGYSSMYNHQDSPNAQLSIDFSKLTGSVVALKNIEKDEEIFIEYKNTDIFPQGKVTLHEQNS